MGVRISMVRPYTPVEEHSRSVSLDQEMAHAVALIESSDLSDRGFEVLLENPDVMGMVLRIYKKNGDLNLEQIARIAHNFSVRTDSELIKLLSADVCPDHYFEHPCERLEHNGEVYFIHPEFGGLEPYNLNSYYSIPIEDSNMNIVCGIKISSRETVVSDLGEGDAVRYCSLAYGFHRDSPFSSSHSGEHNIERYHQPW